MLPLNKELKMSIITQLGSDIFGENAYDELGKAIAISRDGTTIVLGAQLNDVATPYDNKGHVRVYRWDETSGDWIQLGEDIDGVLQDSKFGQSVAITDDGNRIVVGGWYTTTNYHYSDPGFANVYDWNGNSWNLVVQIQGELSDHTPITGGGDSDFGWKVEISGNGDRIAVSSRSHMEPHPDTGGHQTSYGAVKVYSWNGTTYTQLGGDIQDFPNETRYYGHSIALSKDGNRIIIGTPYSASGKPFPYDNYNNKFGLVHVYEWNGTAWVRFGQEFKGESVDGYLGENVDISDDGSRIVFTSDGATRVYEWIENDQEWEKIGNNITGNLSVSMADAGSRIVVGTMSGANSGFRVYDLSGSDWTQFGEDIFDSAFDGFGREVGISGDGSRIITSGHVHDNSNGTDAGTARTYHMAAVPEDESQQSGDICFPAGTPVQTDQGEIAIEKLTSENTIDGVNVVAVVPVYNECDYLVKINKHALGPNYPKKTTLVSRNHRVFVDKKGSDKSVPALALYNGKTITVVQREEHETIYNVLLPTYSKMTINGLVVETLHPKSVYARK